MTKTAEFVTSLFPSKRAFFTYFAYLETTFETVPFQGQRSASIYCFNTGKRCEGTGRRTNEKIQGKKGERMSTRNIRFATAFHITLCCNLIFVQKLLAPCIRTRVISSPKFQIIIIIIIIILQYQLQY